MRNIVKYNLSVGFLFFCLFLVAVKFNSFQDVKHLGKETLQVDKAKELKKSMYHMKTTINRKAMAMDEYLKFYSLDPNIHYPCTGLSRPRSEDITWRKNVYQHLFVKIGNFTERDMYGMKCYFDDRFVFKSGQRHVRCIISVNGEVFIPDSLPFLWKLESAEWRILFWYKDFSDPVGVRCTMQSAAGLQEKIGKTVYYQQFITCIVPEIGILPESASIGLKTCGRPKTNFEVVYPKPAEYPATREIGVCVSSLYGTRGHKDAAYFVNWMEAIKLFGVNEVTLNNGTIRFLNVSMHRVFQYYQDIGRLTFTHYPPLHESWEINPGQEYGATEAVNKMTEGDCLYRNIKRYWYVLIIDIDEVPVPVKFHTYQDFLADYFKRHPNLTLAHSMATRSAYFLKDFGPGNPEYGEHLPFLRLSKRFRTEPMETDGVGVSKSFHNPRNMVGMGHHLARLTHDGGGDKLLHHFMPAEEILIHHIRNRCKYKKYCEEHGNETYHDDTLVKKYGQKLKDNVEYVLGEIGYEF